MKKSKICSCCKKRKPSRLFKIRTSSKDGLYGECNPCLNKKAKIYRNKYPKLIQKNAKKYRESIKGIYEVCKLNGAKERNLIFNISYEDFDKWYKKQPQICHYCERALEKIKLDKHYHRTNRLTIDRKDNNKGYTLNNIILACDICNKVKSNIFTYKEMLQIGKTLKRII